MKVLLTGGTGFLGGHAIDALARAGYQVVATTRTATPVAHPNVHWIKADIAEVGSLPALMRRERPTHLLHMAWRPVFGDVAGSRDNITWLKASLDLADAFIEAGGRRIVGSGSCFEYDWSEGVCTEDVTPLTPSTNYGAAKNALRAALFGMTREAGVSFCWPRMFFTYGPGENETRFVASVARALLRGEPAEMTEGTQVRDFVYAGDIGEALAEIVGGDVTGDINIGSGEPVALRDIAFTLADFLGRRDLLRLGARQPKAHEPALIVANMEKTKRLLNWRARTSLHEGLERMIAAMQRTELEVTS